MIHELNKYFTGMGADVTVYVSDLENKILEMQNIINKLTVENYDLKKKEKAKRNLRNEVKNYEKNDECLIDK